jgi:hypothetical protein
MRMWSACYATVACARRRGPPRVRRCAHAPLRALRGRARRPFRAVRCAVRCWRPWPRIARARPARRYTGYVQGLHETYKKTPVMAQLETKQPSPASFLHTRTSRAPVASPHRVRRRGGAGRGGGGRGRVSEPGGARGLWVRGARRGGRAHRPRRGWRHARLLGRARAKSVAAGAGRRTPATLRRTRGRGCTPTTCGRASRRGPSRRGSVAGDAGSGGPMGVAQPPPARPTRAGCPAIPHARAPNPLSTMPPCPPQDSAKPPSSNIALGDGRINPFVTSYSTGAPALVRAPSHTHAPLLRVTLALCTLPRRPCAGVAPSPPLPRTASSFGQSTITPNTQTRAHAHADFGAPFAGQERLRSPMRNADLAATRTSLREHYASSYNRVGE